jgi:hypothetical protein
MASKFPNFGGGAVGDPNASITNITSNNQTGGITAHTVNLERPPRNFNRGDAEQLDKLLATVPKSDKFWVTVVMNDGEADAYAVQIVQELAHRGYTVEGPDAVMTVPPRDGAVFQQRAPGQGWRVHIGKRP